MCRCDLVDAAATVGAVLRTQNGVKPVYPSPGHGLTYRAGDYIVFSLSLCNRFPDLLRLADHVSRRALRVDGQYVHVEQRWHSAAAEVRQIIELVRTTLARDDESATSANARPRSAVQSIG